MLSSTWEVPEGTMTPKRDSSLCFACDDRRRYEPTRATKSGRAITSVDMDPTLPTTAAEISAGWLTGALHDSGTLPANGTVTAVEVAPATAGVGFLGEVARLLIDYDGDAGHAPPTMIAKFATRVPEVRAMMRPTRIFEREHRFYAELAHETPVRTPVVHHVTCNTSDDDTVDEDYLLLLEDFGELTLGDQAVGVSPDQAESALVGLAAHHARFWGGAGLEQADFIPVIDGPLNKTGAAIYSASLPGFKEVFGTALLPEMVPVADAYGHNHPGLLDRLGAMPHTLVHFDFRADNLFFETDGSVAVIDWQAISQGGGAADVGYFLGQNLTVEDRRAHEETLLHTYHDALVGGGVEDYDFPAFFADYRVGLIYGWVIPVFAVGSLDVSSERAMTLWTNVVERVQDAIFQHGAQRFVDLG